MLRIFIPVLLSVILVGCGNQAAIMSAKDNMVIVRAKPEIFLDALFLAEQECQKEGLPVKYIENYSSDLSVLAFECIVEEETEVEAEDVENSETEQEDASNDNAENIEESDEESDTEQEDTTTTSDSN